MRGELIDIGGRRFRLVREGPRGGGPTVLFEAGSFGGAADFAAVQAALGGGVRSIAYDRAGLGFSDPGPRPRDSRAIASDLRKLLAAAAEPGPFIMVGHSMAAVHLHVFARSHPDQAAGLVFLDAIPPRALADPTAARALGAYRRFARLAPMAAKTGAAAVLGLVAGDAIGVPGAAKAEKRRAFASPVHNAWAAEEVLEWPRDAEQALALGDLDRELPVAVVTAGAGPAAWKALQAEPAHRSRSGYAVNVRKAGHASLLGPRFAPEILKAIGFVAAAGRSLAAEA